MLVLFALGMYFNPSRGLGLVVAGYLVLAIWDAQRGAGQQEKTAGRKSSSGIVGRSLRDSGGKSSSTVVVSKVVARTAQRNNATSHGASRQRKSFKVEHSQESSKLYSGYPDNWYELKQAVIQRDGRVCRDCGCEDLLHLHHLIPLGNGGGNDLDNLAMLCEQCHSVAHGGREFFVERDPGVTPYQRRLEVIQDAIAAGRMISFSYRKTGEDHYEDRVVTPLALVEYQHERNSGSTLCIRAECHLRRAERNFAIKRIRKVRFSE